MDLFSAARAEVNRPPAGVAGVVLVPSDRSMPRSVAWPPNEGDRPVGVVLRLLEDIGPAPVARLPDELSPALRSVDELRDRSISRRSEPTDEEDVERSGRSLLAELERLLDVDEDRLETERSISRSAA